MKKLTLLIIEAGVMITLAIVISVVFIDRAGPVDSVSNSEPLPEPVQIGGADWPLFRGNSAFTGIAAGDLPSKLIIAWRFQTEGPVKSSPVISAGVVYVTSTDKNIYALELASGRKLWQYAVDDSIEAPAAVIGDLICAGDLSGMFYVLSADTGELKWNFKTNSRITGSANAAASADGAKQLILVGSYDNNLYCLDAQTGQNLWTYQTDNYINGAPAVYENITIFGGCDAYIHVVSLTDGGAIHKIDTGSYIAASAAVADGKAYIGTYDDTFICADVKAGKLLWTFDKLEGPVLSCPAVKNNHVIFGCRDKKVYCLDNSTGEMLWQFHANDEVDSSPVICGDKVIVGCSDGQLELLNLSDGSLIWSTNFGQPLTSSPAAAAGFVIIGCNDGYIYALKDPARN